MNSKKFCKYCGREEKDHASTDTKFHGINKCPGDNTKHSIDSEDYWFQNKTYFELYEGIIEVAFEYPRNTICYHCGRKKGNHRAIDKSCPAGNFRDFSDAYWSYLGTSFEPFENKEIEDLSCFCRNCGSEKKYHSAVITTTKRHAHKSLRCPAPRMFSDSYDKEETEAYWNERGTTFESKEVPFLNFNDEEICQNCNKPYGDHYFGDDRCPDIMLVNKRDGKIVLTRNPRDTCFSQEKSLSTSKEDITVVKNDIVIPRAGIDTMVHLQYHWNQEEILKQWGLYYKGNDLWVVPAQDDISLDKIDKDTWLLKLGFNHVYRVWTKG